MAINKVRKLMGAYIDGRFIKLDNMQMKYVREITNNWDKEELELFGHKVRPIWKVFRKKYPPYDEPFN